MIATVWGLTWVLTDIKNNYKHNKVININELTTECHMLVLTRYLSFFFNQHLISLDFRILIHTTFPVNKNSAIWNCILHMKLFSILIIEQETSSF